jgi:ABC-type polysaccharide/polyol phosphate transport system ATPase subunit
MSTGTGSSAYWKLPTKEAALRSFIAVENVSVTFPICGTISKGLDTQSTSKMISGKRGRVRGVRAISDISLSLAQGDRLAIIGENGSGKMTLLQVLAGILAPEIGQIKTKGRVTSLININLGTQPEATGHRNITLRGLAAGYSHAEIEARRQEIADFSEQGDFLRMPIETYSAGIRMRLVFSIATAFQPEILILDEWLSAGDVSFKQKASRRMNDFVAQAGILVLASHSKKLILDNCDEGIWLEQGGILKSGPVADVVAAYEEAQRQKSDLQGKQSPQLGLAAFGLYRTRPQAKQRPSRSANALVGISISECYPGSETVGISS